MMRVNSILAELGKFMQFRISTVLFFSDIFVLPRIPSSVGSLAAIMSRKELMTKETSSDVSCIDTYVAAISTIDTIKDTIQRPLFEKKWSLRDEIRSVLSNFSQVGGVYGQEMVIPIHLKSESLTQKILDACYEQKLLVSSISDRTLLLTPPLTITKQELGMIIDTFGKAVSSVDKRWNDEPMNSSFHKSETFSETKMGKLVNDLAERGFGQELWNTATENKLILRNFSEYFWLCKRLAKPGFDPGTFEL
eukprot:TRINITY_DN2121_c0_g4_i1.p1 TRINITY_DN2121_c0_g4~~TRINITY_DN2121_c0_g4_i1.p1  ORF type:complete len:250 (-),score=38.41 TRINITY_DN2121_c0_g4_i1:67-816(-)